MVQLSLPLPHYWSNDKRLICEQQPIIPFSHRTQSIWSVGRESFFFSTRSCAALWAADLDWIIGPGYSSGRYILEKNQHGTMNNHENQPGPMKKQKRYERGVTNDLGGGQGRNKQKRYRHFSSVTRGHN